MYNKYRRNDLAQEALDKVVSAGENQSIRVNRLSSHLHVMERDAQFVEEVVKMLVDNPDDVKVDRKVDEMGVLITLDVNPEDMGMVIGREGSTAKALRTLLRVVGARNNARVNLKINEPEGSERPQKKEDNEQKTLDEVVGDIQI